MRDELRSPVLFALDVAACHARLARLVVHRPDGDVHKYLRRKSLPRIKRPMCATMSVAAECSR